MATNVDDYRKYYAEKLAQSHSYVDFVTRELIKHHIFLSNTVSKESQWNLGENHFGLEIKFDGRMAQTKNIYIETREKSHPSKIIRSPSGIYRDDNSWLFGIGDYSVFFIFAKKRLQELHRQKPEYLKEREIPTSMGFTIPVEKAKLIADRVIAFEPPHA